MNKKYRKNGLVLGFSVAVLLMVVLLAVGLSSMSAIQDRLTTIVQNHNEKTDLLNIMRYAARERTVSLHRMIIITDPFERDEVYMKFNKFALTFTLARNKLRSLPLSELEKEALEKQGKYTVEAVRLQEQVVDLLVADKIDAAREILYRQAMQAQERVFDELSNLLHIQKDATKRAAKDAATAYERARLLMLVLGVAAIIAGILVAIINIRRTKMTEDRLYREKKRVEITLHSIGDGVISTDLSGRIEYINSAASEITGWSKQESEGEHISNVFHTVVTDDSQHNTDPVMLAMQSQTNVQSNAPVLIARKNREHYAIEYAASPIFDVNQKIIGAVLVFRNITALRNMAHQMAYQATHDSLTGLINRQEFEGLLAQAIEIARSKKQQHVLCYMDLDQFKVVNDTCGHIAGDEMLKQVTGLLSSEIRRSDILGRLGGDEFGILLYDCDTDEAFDKVDRIRKVVRDFHFVWENKSFETGVSVGIVSINEESGGLTEVLSAADSACFAAKDLGRNRCHVYQLNDFVLAQRHNEMQWLPRIKKALTDKHLKLYFQRIVSLLGESENEEFVEILIRMQDEKGQLIPPMAFLPAAERYDLMPNIDRWIVSNTFAAFQQHSKKLHSNAKMLWSVNLSGQSMCDQLFLKYILNQMEKYSVDPRQICFEVTETAAVANLASAGREMAILKNEGFRFVLDDFGSGLSSFNYLKNLPVDFLKIDGNFVKDMTQDKIDMAMVESINQIGHIMGLKTIAEFVENSATLMYLKEHGVDYAQGYHLHKPEAIENYEYGSLDLAV